jgi:molecular chaperone GrpE (heat shock protein)
MRKAAVKPTNEFACAMQQLSAEAENTLPPSVSDSERLLVEGAAFAELRAEVQTLGNRLDGWEEIISRKLDELADTLTTEKPGDFSEHFEKISEQLTVIRGTESVNQRLFDSLHEELLKYRDNFLHESLQKPFIHDLVHLFDDLSGLSDQLGTAAQGQGTRGGLTQWRDNLENAIHSLMEILHRFEVKEIEPRETVDRSVHRVVSYEPAEYAEEDGRIVMRVRCGFFWRGKLIRPEEVIVKRFE